MGKGGMKAEEIVTANEEQKKGAFNSEMQRLRIGEQQTDGGDDALLEEAIKLAAAEEQEMKVKEKKLYARI